MWIRYFFRIDGVDDDYSFILVRLFFNKGIFFYPNFTLDPFNLNLVPNLELRRQQVGSLSVDRHTPFDK